VRSEKTRQKDGAVRKGKMRSDKATQLRRRAEKLLDGNPEALEEMPSKDVRNLIEELRIHQIELEMQNDEFRRSQLELQEARDRYLDLYDFAPTGYMTVNQRGMIIESNLACAELLGVERSRLINSRFSAFVAPGFQDEYYLYVKRVFQATGKQTCELGLKTKDGIPLYVQLQGLALQDPKGDSSQLRLAMTDITEHKEAEAALRETEKGYRDLYENAPNAYFSVSPADGSILRCNSAALDLLGYDRETIMNMKIQDIYADTPDNKAEVARIFKRFKAGESVRDMELQMQRKNGEPLWISLSIRPIKDSNGNVIESRSMVIDITERKRAEKKIRHLARFPSENPNPVLRVAKDGTILYANEASRPFLKTWQRKIDQCLPDEWHQLILDSLDSGLRKDVELEYDDRSFSLTIAPVNDADYVNLYGLDITERKGMEKAVRSARDELEQRVEERTAELARINEELKKEIEDRKRTQQALEESEESVRKVNVALDQGLSEVFQALRKIASGDPSVRIPETSELDLLVKLKHAVNVTAQDLATIINLTHEFAMGLAEYFDVLQRVSRGDFTARVTGDSPIDLLGALKRDINQMIHDISTEIAERKRVAQALRERQASLAEAQRIAHLGNWDWNIETNELRWSDEIYRIFGLTPQEFGATYDAFLDSVHPDDRESVKKAVDEALYDDKRYSIHHRVVLPDGTERIVQEQAEITFNNKGKPIRMIGTVQDITERKRAEKALEGSEAELRRLSARLLDVQEAERKTISRELHDSIGQSLAAIKFGVENCLHRTREVAEKETVESLEALVPVVQRASEEVRRIHTDLRPSLLDDLGIMATISWFCREFQGLYSGLRIEQDIDIEEKQVVDSLKIVIFRLLQEALNNVAKYGKGDTVRVSLREKEGHIELAIQDNGRGFDVDQVRSTKSLRRGFGLTSMKERTELSGGSFSIESAPEAGTLVRASWPMRTIEPA
jgi:PAS domain S-box-containing protein